MQREWFEQKRVRLADIDVDFRTHAGLVARLREFSPLATDCGPSKAFRYQEAMAAGAEFPPVLISRRDGVCMLHDGFHRCAAAVLSNRKSIDAVVFNLETDEEQDLVGLLAREIFEMGVPWQVAVEFIRDALAGRKVAA